MAGYIDHVIPWRVQFYLRAGFWWPFSSVVSRCSKDYFSLGSSYLVRVLVCATLKDKSGEAEIRRLYTGNIKLDSNTAINASPMGLFNLILS